MKKKIEKPEIIEGFHAVEFFRKIKDEISRDIYGLSYDEMMKYFEDRRRKFAEQGVVLRDRKLKKELALA